MTNIIIVWGEASNKCSVEADEAEAVDIIIRLMEGGEYHANIRVFRAEEEDFAVTIITRDE